MAITIDEMSTEVLAEPSAQLAGAAAVPSPSRLDEQAKVRFALAQSARLEARLSAEGYDD